MHKMRYFFTFKTWTVTPTYFFLFIWGVVITNGGGPLVTGPATVTLPAGYGWACMLALNSVIGLFSSLAVNMPDFGRFSANTKSTWSQVWALPLIGTLGSLAPIFVTNAGMVLYGEQIWYFPALIANFTALPKFFVGVAMAIATLGNNLAAGSYPFANDISSLAPKYINIFRASLIMAVFCIISQPWLIIKNGAALLSFLSGYSIFMASFAAILVVDFYIIRKKRLDIRQLYTVHGIYYYNYGVNWRAWLTFIISVTPCLPGLAANTNPNIAMPIGVLELFYMSWPFGFAVSSILYYVLCTYVSPPTETLVTEAVYPPATEEEERMLIEGIKVENGSVGSEDKIYKDAGNLTVLEVK